MLLPATPENITRAARCLACGGLVAFPTETVYGLGADAFNTAALARVFEVKRRPFFDPLIIHIAKLSTLERLVDFSALGAAAKTALEQLSQTLMPGPLTLVLPKLPSVPDLATGGLPTLAVRFPSHEAARALIAQSTGAIAAPSANPFGYLSPTRAEHVAGQLGGSVDIILDGGACPIGVESTVLDLSHGSPRILRPGGTSLEQIEAVIGTLNREQRAVSREHRGDVVYSPGQLGSHYAPKTKLFLLDTKKIINEKYNDNSAYLFFDKQSYNKWIGNNGVDIYNSDAVFILSDDGELREAASHLFTMLHTIDALDYQFIYAERAPEIDLGLAINDRLTRASNK